MLVDAHLLQEQSCQISSRSDLKRRSLGLFNEVAPTTTTTTVTTTTTTTSDMRSVPDLKNI